MAFSFNSYTGDNSTTEFAITFDYLTETVVVSADPKGIEVHLDGVKQTSGYTINTSTNKVNFTTAPTTGKQVSILRVTPRGKNDRLIDFADGTIITEAQLDTVALQLLYIAQEAFEQTNSGGSAAPTYLSYDEVNGYWSALYNASTQTIRSLKLPTADDAAATKKYVDDVATWGISGVPQQWTFSGNGTTDSFVLTGGPNIEEEMLVVAIDGVLQIPNTDFSVIQGSTDSTLDFDTAPASSTVISVQNFGKMRFLDGLDITDGSVTTVKLDQTSGSEAVSTATIRDDAVTAAKIADSTVDLARINTSAFTTSSGDTTPRFLSVPVSGTGLSLGTLTTGSISDFNSSVNAKRLNDFQAPNGALSMGTQKITNLVDPTSNQEAATKKYVDDELLSVASSGMVRLGVFTLGSNSSSMTVGGWYSTDYTDYEFYCTGFAQANSTIAAIVMEFADSTGTYRTSGYSVSGQAHVLTSTNTDPYQQFHDGGTKMALATVSHESSGTYDRRQAFRLWLPANRSTASWNKSVAVSGHGQLDKPSFSSVDLLGGDTSGPEGMSQYHIVNHFTYSTDVITGIRFKATDDVDDTSFSGNIRSGARVVVYGRKG